MNLHVGLVVRCEADFVEYKDGTTAKSQHCGKIGTITEHVGKRMCHGKVYDFWRVDIAPSEKFADQCLVPINPDDEACGTFEEMMDNLKEIVHANND
jgi:RNA 3'-terminal phosphate cyclase